MRVRINARCNGVYQFQKAYFELKRFNIRISNKDRPKEENEYEYFVSKFRAKVRKFKEVSTFAIPGKTLVHDCVFGMQLSRDQDLDLQRTYPEAI